MDAFQDEDRDRIKALADRARMLQVLRRLSRRQRELLLVMILVPEVRPSEVADVMRVSRSNVWIQLRRAIDKLLPGSSATKEDVLKLLRRRV